MPFPSNVGETDLKYLRLKGALNVPSSAVRAKLWECYFQLVHPNLPILDRDQVMRCLSPGTNRQKISLLLFHCVMLTAQLFLDVHQNGGTNPASFKTMFDRARMLFNLGWETDPHTLLQSALLLSHYPQSSPTMSRGPHYWVSQAVSLAYAIGLHRSPTEGSLSPREQSLRKQLWWSMYIRERLVTTDCGLPSIIREDTYDMPMLALKDFESAPLWPSDDDSSTFTSQDTIDQKRHSGVIFIEKAKIALIIGRLVPISILEYGYEEQPLERTWPRIQSKPVSLAQLDEIRRDLNLWAKQLPLEILCIQTKVSDAEGPAPNIIFNLNHSMLFILYHLVTNHLASLHWLQAALPSRNAPEEAITALWAATRPIINLVDDLIDDNMMGYFQLIGPSLIRPLLLCKMLNRIPTRMYPILETERIPLLVEKIGKSDRFYTCALCFLEMANKVSPNASTPERCENDVSASRGSPTQPNVFDALLDDYAFPSYSIYDISTFEQIFESWDSLMTKASTLGIPS